MKTRTVFSGSALGAGYVAIEREALQDGAWRPIGAKIIPTEGKLVDVWLESPERVAHTCCDQPNLPCPACARAETEDDMERDRR
jgi:hypothetical protein